MTYDSRTTYEVWKKLIFDEDLCQALFDGSYTERARSQGFGDDEIAVLDFFKAQPGTRWNIENLRFRAALETGATISIYLPWTVRILTKGEDDWLQDIAYEYLAHHRWDALGHLRLTECERFGAYVHERIMKRRATPPELDPVMEFELAVVDVLRQTAAIPRDGWPSAPALTDAEVATSCPRRCLAQRILQQQVDARDFMKAEVPKGAAVRQRPIIWFIYMASPETRHRVKVLSEGAREVLERCTGRATIAQIAAELEHEFDLPRADVINLVRTWLGEGILLV